MDREELKKELKFQMEELLQAAAEFGFYFTFETISNRYIEYGRNDVVTIYSDEKDFGIEIYDNKGGE